GNNSFSGGTSVNQGTLTAGSASALGSGKATVANGAILQLNMGGDTSFANTLAGTGKLVQAGNNTVNLTAAGSSVGEVEVAAGGLTLAQNGTFTAGNYTTKNNALTTVNSGAQMVVTGQFTQEAGSALAVRIGASNDPAIRTGSATISGSLDISGFNNGALNRSSAIPTERYTVISSGTAIQGEFDPVTIDSTAPVDYLTVTGTFSSDRREYYVGMDLTWNASTDRANGTFNVANAFLVDTVLRDRSDETFDSLWSGQDLVKSGNDTLTLAAANTFEGTTTVEAGTLVLQT
ncbi:MAG: autotransporter-associated beta strand repeat-containing protein, partial [Planctomycetes bacterium]|nr:autotransporter-associated beta strand repeat-containing protein [Planctomycetota bacterium]